MLTSRSSSWLSSRPAVRVRNQARSEDAEAARRTEEQQTHELAKAGSGVAVAPPKTLSMLLEEFFVQHVEKKLAAKTIERYRDQAGCLDLELLAMPLSDITPLHLNREEPAA